LVWQLSQPNLNNFQPFQKLLRLKQPIDSTKEKVVFHLVVKILYFKKDLKHISFRFNKGVNYKLNYPDPTQTQQQHQPFIKDIGFGFFKIPNQIFGDPIFLVLGIKPRTKFSKNTFLGCQDSFKVGFTL